MANKTDSSKRYWELNGEKIRINGKEYSIFYLSLLGFIVKVISLGLVIFSLFSFIYSKNLASVIGLSIAVFTFLTGIIISNIANKANDLYLDALEKESERKHEEICRKIKENK